MKPMLRQPTPGTLIGLVLVAFASVSAQTPQEPQKPQEPQTPVFRSNARTEVPIYATVMDSSGRLVPDLDRADFTVLDDGKPVELTQFSNATQPFTAVVMLDTSASMTANLELLNQAAEQFLLRLLPVDRAQVGAFNDKIQLSGRFTNNRDELVRRARRSAVRQPDATERRDCHQPRCAREHRWATRGAGVHGWRRHFEQASGSAPFMDRARDEEVMVYAIGLESEYFNGQRIQRSRPSRDLRKIADETGGGYFELKKNDQLAPTFTRVAQELRSQYLLGFAPATLDNKVHKLDVRARQGMTVRARKSYLATPDRKLTSN